MNWNGKSEPEHDSGRPPRREDRPAAAEAARQLFASLSDREDLKFVFRELAKELLDPKGESEVTLCDNAGNVLGYYTPSVCYFRNRPRPAADPNMDLETFLKGSEPADEFFARIFSE